VGQLERWVQSMADGTFDFGLLDDEVVIWHSNDGLDMTLDEERALVAFHDADRRRRARRRRRRPSP
jgi:hypothetical protein